MWKPVNLDTDKVLYVAIAEEIERNIAQGLLKPGERMPAQRTLAKIIGVNLTTITRAYKEAEKRGLITGTVGSGTYVTGKDGRTPSFPEQAGESSGMIEMGLVGSLKGWDLNLGEMLKTIAEDGSLVHLMDYTPSQGLLRHRQIASQWMARSGMTADPNRIVVSAGAQHAISCCLMGLFEPGDRIATDCLTFTGMKSAARMNRIKLEPIAMDDGGMIPESLENACKRGGIKGIYLMPAMQNPTATTIPAERRHELAQIISRYDLILIEDDSYSFTGNQSQPAMSTLVPEQAVYICGISKSFYPGLRVAFVVLPERFLLPFTQAIVNSLWMTPALNTELVCRCIENGMADRIIQSKREIITRRMKIARDALTGFSFHAPETGMFLWLKLPEGMSCAEFENIARMNQVSVFSAYKFYVGNTLPPNAVRISVSGAKSDEELKSGLKILLRILKQDAYLSTPVM